MMKEQELIKSELRNELTRKASYSTMNPISSERLRIVTDERIETRFLSELLKMIGADK